MDRHSGGGPPPHLRGRPVSGLEAAHANEYFEPFLNATTLKNILGYHRSMCEFLHLKPNVFTHFYPKLRANLTSWRAKALWKKFDARASHKCYAKGKSCSGTRVLVIGAGPCGLRSAIEAQLLGAKVVVVEKRDRLSRNNVLHLWPFVIEDLRMLGAKKFFGKFCAGAIDHISIRQLQCILLKVALLLGVEVHTEVSFEKLLEPSSIEKTGWRAQIKPDNHPVAQYEFDVIIAADGKRNTLQGFKRKEFRGKLAIAITANFINKKSEAEARVEEISGVAFIFNQKFFKDLQKETRIDLENIVYYKDDTHYFVMTAKKASLLEKGVIKQDLSDTEKLLAPENVDRDALQNYARQAADFSTNYQLPELEFAVNHYGQPDVAMFDFTSMYAAEYASKVVERHGCRLLMMLVGDSLLEPFWPTGSGCARGFLSSLDAAWAIRSYCSGQMTPLDVLAERESIYRLLAQTTPDNLNKDWKAYTLDPATRYPNLNKSVVTPHQTVCLYDTDNANSIEKMKRASLEAAARFEHVPKKRRRGNVDNEVLLGWLSEQLRDHPDIKISDVNSIFRDGKVLCAIIHHYRPDLLDYGAMKDNDAAKCNQSAMDILERDLGVPPFMTGAEITKTEDYLAMATYLTQVYDTFRGEIPHIKHPKLKMSSSKPSSFMSRPEKIPECNRSRKSQISNEDVIVFDRRRLIEKWTVSKQKNVLSQHTFLTSSIKSFESTKKEQKLDKPQYFDVTYNCEQQVYTCTHVIRESVSQKIDTDKNIKKVKSRNVAVSANTTVKKKKPKSKLPIIPENAPEERPKQKSLNCDTIIQNSFEPGPSLLALFIPPPIKSSSNSTKPTKRKSSIINKQIISPRRKLIAPRKLPNLGILDTIRKHLLLKKRQLGMALSHQKIETKSQFSQTDANLVYTRSYTNSSVFLSKNGSVQTSSTCIHKKVEQIYENKEKFVRDNSSHRCTHTSWLKERNSAKKKVSFQSNSVVECKQPIETNRRSAKALFTKPAKFSRTEMVEKIFDSRKAIDRLVSTKCWQNVVFEKRMLGDLERRSKKKSLKPPPIEKPPALTRTDRQVIKLLGSTMLQNSCHPDKQFCNNSSKLGKSSRGNKRGDPKMEHLEDDVDYYKRVMRWISREEFERNRKKIEIGTHVSRSSRAEESIKSTSSTRDNIKTLLDNLTNEEKFKKHMLRVAKSRMKHRKSVSVPPTQCSVIFEGEELLAAELPENKYNAFPFKSIKTSNHQISTTAQPRPSSRHKRHADILVPSKLSISVVDKKQRKRRTIERLAPSIEERQKTLEEISANRLDRQSKRKQQRQRQTEQFLKSMQMLHANCKPDQSEPFEDYSIFLYRQTAPKFKDRVKDLEKQFTYVPDHDTRLTGLKPLQNTNAEEDIASKIKSLEDKWSNKQQAEKKPKDLMRAIGKIETSDWNIQQIEKKILENKIGKPSTLNADKERVPRWSKEEFRARQTKMEKKHLDKQESVEAKFADIDRNIKQLELKLKEGTNRELGQNKVATITERLVSKVPQEKEKMIVEKPKAVNLPIQSGSEFCHFCGKRVYLMERLSAESRFFHHGCFKCQYCHSQLRLGSYMFDHDGQYGFKFFCMHHYGMQGELPRPTKVARKPSQKRESGRSPHKKHLSGVKGLDLLDRVQTPERIEFSNLSTGNISSDHEEPLSQMDEDEWTDKNFGTSCNELDESDDDESSISDTDSDDEDAYDDALEQPITKEGTMKWAERWKNSYRKGRHSDSDGYSSSDHSSYYENSSDDSDSDTATEGEEEIRARELRRQEVRVEPPVVQTDTGTDTEMVSEESSSSSEIQNSATEISTDSEFAQDDPTPTRELPSIALNDFHVTKTRGSGSNYPKRIQVTTGYIQQPKPNIELKLNPLVPTNFRKPAPLKATEGYALNRTQSTGGIAAKVSLELKKKYLLGESGTNSIQKSGSASTLDTKFKSFQNTITDCQKLLKPAPEVSASMQMFCNKLDERHSPVSKVAPEATLPPPDITITTITETKDDQDSETRPRSPIHEASIPVPSIDWSKNKSQSSDSLSLSSQSENEASFHIPRVEVHEAKEEGEMALDSLCIEAQETNKTITTDKKILNQPKSLPNLHNDIHKALHVRVEDSPAEASGKSSPEVTTALTETELSDWARDENASDSIDMDMSQDSDKKKIVKIANLSEFDEHVCGKVNNKTILTEALNNALSGNLDHIEYMDTGTETSSDEAIVDSQNGYVLFKNEEEIFEAKNVYLHKKEQENTGYCEIVNNFGGKVIDLKPHDLERLKQKQTLTDHEEDSLVIIDTTTEENTTCSDSTVKNITEIHPDRPAVKIENMQKQRLEEKLAKVKAELKSDKENVQYEEHCQRLQSKVEFGNARDSIDIRKSRRKSKSDAPQQKPDLIQEEEPTPAKDITLNLAPVRPDVLYKKETIKKERDVNKKLIEEMVMNKMKAENKSLERKKRNRANLVGLSPYNSPSPNNSTPDLLSNTKTPIRPLSVFSATKLPETPLTNPENFSMPDIRKNLFASDDFRTPKAPPRYNRPSDVTKTAEKMKESARARARLLSNEDLGLSPEDKINKLREKFNNNKRDTHVQESIESLVLNTERRNSLLYSNDTLTKKRNGSFRRSKSGDSDINLKLSVSVRPKSVSEIPKNLSVSKNENRHQDNNCNKKICKSDPNLLDTSDKKKSKDGERRKSITKLIAGIFTKKSPTGGLFAKLSPKSKAVSKEPKLARKSQSEINIKPPQEPTPPPIPPLPVNYSIKDESSDGELQQRSSCDTLDQSDNVNGPGGSRKSGKARRVSRQAQLKRHRMAQEIQRKLEETEVKTRELEQRGVEVEKALRGEDDGNCLKDESELLQEWFDLMRDRTELRRYEKELMVRAQELELEDRHSRLQVDLRERLESNENKTEADLKVEESIINEMMDIVAKRDTLIAVLEEDRLRYSHEDKDLEEQMLAKGLMLTPIQKSPEK